MTGNERDWVFGDRSTEVDVVLEPTAEHTAAEVAGMLRDRGASHVEVVSESHVSARVDRATVEALGEVATAHPKVDRRMHHRPR